MMMKSDKNDNNNNISNNDNNIHKKILIPTITIMTTIILTGWTKSWTFINRLVNELIVASYIKYMIILYFEV